MIVSNPVFGQSKPDTVWYDASWNQSHKQDAAYYRAGFELENVVYRVKDRYRDGAVQMDGTYSSMNPDMRSGIFKYYAHNKRLTAEEVYANDLLDGLSIFYDSLTGNIISRRLYRSGKLEGISTFYRAATGKLSSEQMYANGRREGLSIYYDSVNGNTILKEDYRDGKLEGLTTSYYPATGKVKMTRMYVNDSLGGGLQKFDSSGVLRMEVDFDNGPLGSRITYDSVGRITSKGGIDKQGLGQGPVSYFDPITGNLIREVTLVNDTSQGVCKQYDPVCHNILATGNMVNGKREGYWKIYRSCDTSLYKKFFLKQGIADGSFMIYDIKSGMLLRKGQDSAGLETGEWTYYFPGTNAVHMTRNYRAGKLHGALTTYFSNGALRRKEQYDNNKLIAHSCYGLNGADTLYYNRSKYVSYQKNYLEALAKQIHYPEIAKAKGLEGRVELKVTINEYGVIDNVFILSSTNEIFNSEAIRIAKLIRIYHAQLEDDEPIETYINVPIVFSLSK